MSCDVRLHEVSDLVVQLDLLNRVNARPRQGIERLRRARFQRQRLKTRTAAGLAVGAPCSVLPQALFIAPLDLASRISGLIDGGGDRHHLRPVALGVLLQRDTVHARHHHCFHFIQREIARAQYWDVVRGRAYPREQQERKQELLQAPTFYGASANSCRGAGPNRDCLVPPTQILVVLWNARLGPELGEINRTQRRDVRNGNVIAGDKLVAVELSIKHFKEPPQTLTTA